MTERDIYLAGFQDELEKLAGIRDIFSGVVNQVKRGRDVPRLINQFVKIKTMEGKEAVKNKIKDVLKQKIKENMPNITLQDVAETVKDRIPSAKTVLIAPIKHFPKTTAVLAASPFLLGGSAIYGYRKFNKKEGTNNG